MKRAQVVWSDEALTDLDTIYEFLAEKSNAAAQRKVKSLLERSRQLESFPESGAIQQATTNTTPYRFLVEGNYKIIYRYQSEVGTVFIATIFDTRLDPEKMRD